MPEAPAAGFNVNGKFYPVPETLTMGEMCDAEQHFGVEFGNNKSSGVRLAAAMLWIAIRREDPSVTPEDIRELPPEVFAGLDEPEGDALPPEKNGLAIVSDDDEPEKKLLSGEGSSRTGDGQEETPEPIGTPA